MAIMAEARTLIAGVDSDADVLAELAGLHEVYGSWETFIGAGGTLVYARRLLTSPPVIYSAPDTAALWQKVRNWESGDRG